MSLITLEKNTPVIPYNNYMNYIRQLASPNLLSPITECEFPNEILNSPIYLHRTEANVFRELKLTEDSYNQLSDDKKYEVVFMMILLQASRLSIQLRAQYVNDESWKTHIKHLEDSYIAHANRFLNIEIIYTAENTKKE